MTFKNGEKYEFTYDSEGNLVSKTIKLSNGQVSKLITYAYNYQNQPVEIKENGVTIAQYGYDTNKQRIYKKNAKTGEEIVYNWDASGHIISEGPKTNPYETRYIYSGNDKIAFIKDGKTYYISNNLQGTFQLISDKSGKIVQKTQLDEWGNEEGKVGLFPDEINYTGKKLDQETGLYYFNQRYYDPTIGRFLAEDSARQGLNPYAYCGNNPTMYIDPDGQIAWVAVLIAAIQGAAMMAVVDIGFQLTITGYIDWDQAGQAAIAGAIGGALNSGGGIVQAGQNAGVLETIGVNIGNEVIVGGVQSLASGENYHMAEFGRDVAFGTLKGMHYYRNELNKDLPINEPAEKVSWSKLEPNQSRDHQLQGNSGNKKFVHTSGKEAIYDASGKLVTSKLNMGTYNFVNPGDFRSFSGVLRHIGHFMVDMVPYYAFGNSRYDGSWINERTLAYSIGY